MRSTVVVLIGCALFGPWAGAIAAPDPASVQDHLDLAWILVASALVFFMQAGFAALETGMIRAKNSLNVAAKNSADILVSALLFFGLGYAVMFGETAAGLIGTDGFLLSGIDAPFGLAFFLFQLVFAGTAATIVSGAVAERMRFRGYLLVTALVSGLVYPISGHWIWGEGGWLAELGFVDFAGSTVVHSLGGWVGLAGAAMLGARWGRFGPDGEVQAIPPHNLLLTALGVFILWLGWFGFNGGSTLAADETVAGILVNTFLAAAAGGTAGLVLIPSDAGTGAIAGVLNGILGGLVAVTAGADTLSPLSSVAVGFLGGVVVLAGEWFLLHILRIDDPVGAVPVHAFAGAWGTLAVALFAPIQELPAATRITQIGVQGLGILAVATWGLAAGILVFGLLRSAGQLRVSPEDEDRGLNEAEHGARTVWLDTLQTMRTITDEHDLSRRAPEEPHTEAGDVARGINELLDSLAHTFSQWQSDTERVASAGEQLSGSAEAIAGHAQDSAHRLNRVGHSVAEANTTAQDVAEQIRAVSRNASEANDRTQDGREAVSRAVADIRALQSAGERVEGANRTIEEIANKTDLLALNASIEAANAGEAGQGFGVVAEEVRNLASQTAKATDEVGNLLEELQHRADQSAQAVESLENTMDGMARSVEQTDHSADQIARGAEKLAEAMDTAAQETQEVGESINTVARYGSEVHSASGDLGHLAQGLRRSLAAYRLPETAPA